MDLRTDTTLWERFTQGDPGAFSDLYRLHHNDLLWSGIRFCGDAELVRDEINQQFLQLWDKKASLPSVTHVRTYLIRSLRNQLINALKVVGRSVPAEDTDTASPSWEEELIGIEHRDQIIASVKKAIQDLAPRQRQVVFLRYYQGLAPDEIASRTGLTTRTVYNTLNTALQRLREALGPRHAGHLDKLLSLLLLVS